MIQNLTTPQAFDFKPLIYTGFGYFLGFFSNVLTQWINRRKLRKELIKGLHTQFEEILPRCLSSYYSMNSAIGNINRDVLTWLHSAASGIIGFPESIRKAIEDLLKLDDAQLISVSLQSKRSVGKGKYIKKYNLPYLEKNISSISLLSPNLQHSILAIQTKIEWLNEEVERNNFFFEKTFDQITPENYDILIQNENSSYEHIGKLNRELAELISKLLKDLSK